jgi:circadian clock protein KaiC
VELCQKRGGVLLTKISIGVRGFDNLLNGGVIAGNTVLVEGIPGAGKTTLGMEFIYRGIRDFGEPGIILTFEQFPESLYRDARSLGWDLRALEKENKLRVICTSPEVVLQPELNFLEEVVQSVGAKRMLVDSISHFRQVVNHPFKLRQAVYSFCNGLHRLGLTSFLIKELEGASDSIYSFEEFLVDVVVRLHYEARDGLSRQRTIEVVKSRGQAHVSGRHSFQITEGGIRVFSLRPMFANTPKNTSFGRQLPTGIKGLDDLIGEGLPPGITILVAGETGTGKSVLGLEYLVKGALLYQQKGLFVSLEEPPERVYFQSADFSWDMEALAKEGKVQVIFKPFVDTEFDELAIDLVSYIRDHQIQRLVLDPLPALISQIEDVSVLREKLYYLTANLNKLGCTSLFLYPLGSHDSDKQFAVAQSLVQGSILLKYAWFQNRRLRQLELYKLRGVNHVTGNHLMEITEKGIQVFPRQGGLRT